MWSAGISRRRNGAWILVALAISVATAHAVSLEDVDTITILPIVYPADPSRVQRGELMQALYGPLDTYVYKALLRKLALKGYVLDRPRRWSRPPDWTVEALKALPANELSALLPKTTTFAALLFVERVSAESERIVESSADAKVSAMILHRASSTVVWQRQSEGEFHETVIPLGPIGMLITPDKHAAVEDAFGRLFADFPEKAY